MDIDGWLRGIGLEQYTQTFRDNAIDDDVLGDLTDDHLRELGLPLGARLKLLRAVAALGTSERPKFSPEIKPTVPRTDAERRQLTVMFVDLVGSTALSARLDPEDMREIVGAYHRSCAEQITKAGGFVAKYMGDGVLAYFGYPHAHEHDAERAVLAGLALVEAVPILKTAAGTPLQVRIGIATGLVVVGDLIGSGEAQERGVVGDTPNLAARLQALAEPNMVVIAESMRRLLGNLFELRDLGPQELKGIAGPARAWAALRASSVESRFDALHTTNLTALVGREEELDLLLRRWSKAKSGEGQVVLLSGEAGIGKSRLTAALLERLSSEAHTRLRYFSSPQHTDSALYPIIGQMERAAGLTHDDKPQAKLDRLDALLARSAASAVDRALLAELLSLPSAERYPVLELSPPQRRQRTLEALARHFQAMARQQPMLMIFEDVHWIDPTSLEALSHTVENVRGIPVLLIVTFRPEFNPPWTGQSHVTAVTLNRLHQSEATAIVERIAGDKPLSQALIAEIIERTDGVPLFVEEMTKAILESGETQAAHIVSAVPSPSIGVPASLHASLMARLDRLGPAKQVAQIGAAIGREFSYELLSAAAHRKDSELVDALERLTDSGLLYREGVPPHATFLFKHALVQDAAYGTLLREARRNIHERIAEALSKTFPQTRETQPEVLAHHFTQAGLTEAAVHWWGKAGQQALVHSAMLEAEGHLRKGLNILATLPDGTERQEYELDLQMALADAVAATHGLTAPTWAETIARARLLCEKLSRPTQLAMVLASQCNLHLVRGELELACQESKELLDLGKVRNDPFATLSGCNQSALAWFCRGDFTASRGYAEQALTLYDPAISSTVKWTIDLQATALELSCRSLTYLGYLDKARLSRSKALAHARQIKHVHTLAAVLAMTSLCDVYFQSDPALLLQDAEDLAELCTEHGFPYWAVSASWARGASLSELGRPGEALTVLEEALSNLRAIGGVTGAPLILTSLAEAFGKLDHPIEGLQQLEEARRQIEATQERWTECDMHRVRGELLIAVGDLVAAEASIRQGIAVARRQNAKLCELRASMSLARFWLHQRRPIDARDLLAPVYNWFSEGFDTPVLKEAQALLDELSRSTEPS